MMVSSPFADEGNLDADRSSIINFPVKINMRSKRGLVRLRRKNTSISSYHGV